MSSNLLLGFVVMMLFSGCGNSTVCALKGDNLKGRVTFAGHVPVQTSAAVVVEWSRDSFSTVSGRSISKDNIQGLLSVPYSLCVDNDVDLQVRAYEDINDNASPDGSEYAGSYDQGLHVPTSSNWQVKEGVDIVIDTP